jgi:GTP-binding protein HflX
VSSEELYLELLRENERLRNQITEGGEVLADDENFQLELEERRSLRRVVGISTELEDVSIAENRQLRLERVVLVGVWTEGSSTDAENSLRELAALAETAGSEVLEGLMQRRDKPDSATFIGSGKVSELRQVVAQTGADTVYWLTAYLKDQTKPLSLSM